MLDTSREGIAREQVRAPSTHHDAEVIAALMSGRSMGRGIAAFLGLAAPIHPKERLVRRQRPVDEAANEAGAHGGGVPGGARTRIQRPPAAGSPGNARPRTTRNPSAEGCPSANVTWNRLSLEDGVQDVSGPSPDSTHQMKRRPSRVASFAQAASAVCAAPFPRTKPESHSGRMQASLHNRARSPAADVMHRLDGGAGLGADCRRVRTGSAAWLR